MLAITCDIHNILCFMMEKITRILEPSWTQQICQTRGSAEGAGLGVVGHPDWAKVDEVLIGASPISCCGGEAEG